jgi:D-3-phosphoglycerate dehydrogenase
MLQILVVGDAFFEPDPLKDMIENRFPGKTAVRTIRFSFPESEYPIDSGMPIPSGMLLEDPKKKAVYPDIGVKEFYADPLALSGKVLDAEVIVIHGAALPRKVIEEADKLKAVIVLRGGPENVDRKCLHERGVKLLQTSGKNAHAVAEFVLGSIIDFERGITYGNTLLQQDRWWIKLVSGRVSHELQHKTFGLIGYGKIARCLRGLLTGFSARVLAYDPYQDKTVMERDDVRPASLEEVVREADYVSLHARAQKGDPPMMNARLLSMMRPDAVLVNSARGSLLDYEALENALDNRLIRGAVLDVLGENPFGDYKSLIGRENVLVTPHIAGSSEETVERGYHMAIDLLTEIIGS